MPIFKRKSKIDHQPDAVLEERRSGKAKLKGVIMKTGTITLRLPEKDKGDLLRDINILAATREQKNWETVRDAIALLKKELTRK